MPPTRTHHVPLRLTSNVTANVDIFHLTNFAIYKQTKANNSTGRDRPSRSCPLLPLPGILPPANPMPSLSPMPFLSPLPLFPDDQANSNGASEARACTQADAIDNTDGAKVVKVEANHNNLRYYRIAAHPCHSCLSCLAFTKRAIYTITKPNATFPSLSSFSPPLTKCSK